MFAERIGFVADEFGDPVERLARNSQQTVFLSPKRKFKLGATGKHVKAGWAVHAQEAAA
jgi:hypothetical protein